MATDMNFSAWQKVTAKRMLAKSVDAMKDHADYCVSIMNRIKKCEMGCLNRGEDDKACSYNRDFKRISQVVYDKVKFNKDIPHDIVLEQSISETLFGGIKDHFNYELKWICKWLDVVNRYDKEESDEQKRKTFEYTIGVWLGLNLDKEDFPTTFPL